MLTPKEILTASFLEIVFDGRNKAYGAYELRSNYQQRMLIALFSIVAACLALFLWPKNNGLGVIPNESIPDLTVHLTPYEPTIIPPVPQPVIPQLKAIHTEIFTAPIFTSEPIPDELKAPEMDVLIDAKIGLQRIDGDKFEGQAPTVITTQSSTVVAPIVTEAPEIFELGAVDQAAEFPGGLQAWRRYLEKNLRYPESAQDNNTQGEVAIQFVIDENGVISNIQVVNDPGDGLGQEAVRILKRGPQWRPAKQNGKNVKYRHLQKIRFTLAGE